MKSKTLPVLHLLTLCLLTASQTQAAEFTWADSAGNTAFFNGTSWVGGVAPANSTTTDTAVFTSVANAQPVIGVQSRIRGIDFRMADGGLAMTSTNQQFQIGVDGFDSSLQTSGTNTITNARIRLMTGAGTWNLFSSNNTASTSTFTFDSNVELAQNLTVIGQRHSAVGNVGIINFDRVISDVGSLTINSSNTNNTVNLKGVNTYKGGTIVNGGIVNVQNNQNSATGGWNIQTTDTAGKLATVNFTAGSTVAVAGTNKIQIGATANSGSHPASTLNVAGTVDNDGALQMERASNLNLNNGAVWDQAGNLTLTARGGSSATLNVNAGAQMTYTGSSTVKLNNSGTSGGSGSLGINGTGLFTTAAGFENTSSVTTGNGMSRVTLTDGGTLKLSADVANLTTNTRFNLAGTGGVIDNGGFSTTLSGAFSGSVANTTTGITGTGGLTSTGSGTLTLSGTNTYTGNTLVSAGTLLVNGSLASNSAVTVDSAAIFGGIGTVNGNLAFHADSFFRIADLNTPLTVSGVLSFGSGFGIANLLGLNWDTLDLNTAYTLITTDQTFTDSDIDNFGIGNAFDVGTGRRAYFQTGSLQVVVVPEPGSALLGGIGILMLLRRRRN